VGWKGAHKAAWALVEAAAATDRYFANHAVAVADLSQLVRIELGTGEVSLETLEIERCCTAWAS